MAGKITGRRKPAAKPASKAKAAEKKAVAKPKTASNTAAKAQTKPKPAPTAKPKPAPAAKQKAGTAPDLVLALANDLRSMPGCGFGIGQSVTLGTIAIRLPSDFDLEAIDPLLEEFALAPPPKWDLPDDRSREMHGVARLMAWHMAIQRGLNVPVFGNGRLRDMGAGEDGVRRFSFAVPTAARPATTAALQFVIAAILSLASGSDGAALQKRFATARQAIARHTLVGLNAIHFAEAAHDLGIQRSPWTDQVQAYGTGRNRVLLNSSVTNVTPQIGVSTAKDKLRCAAVLRAAGLPVANSTFAQNADTAVKQAGQIGYPVVIKPADMDQGAGVTAGIEDEADLRRAFEAAAKISRRVMIEKHHYGRDYRVTVLHGKVIKIMDRRPGGVTGDGTHSVAQLVALSNAQDKANRGRMGRQRAPMVIDEEAQKLLAARGFTADSVIPADEFVALRRRSNISAGGTYEILPPKALHPDNRALAVNAAAALGLDLAGIDVISADPARSWRETGGIIVEVNAQPQIGYRDTEQIFGEILREVIGGQPEIPAHLLLLQDGSALPAPLPRLATNSKCNAAAWGTNAWIGGVGLLGPFPNPFAAGKGVLLDTRASAALIALTEQDVLRFGLPAAKFASIRLIGRPDWQPAPILQQLIAGHSRQIVRQNASPAAGAAA